MRIADARRPSAAPALSRRALLGAGLLGITGCVPDPSPTASPSGSWSPSLPRSTSPAGQVMPDEGARHARTWMAFGASAEIWGEDLVVEVRENLAAVAAAIARFEPVTMVVRPDEVDLAAEYLDPGIDTLVAAIDDLWIRDTGPTFVLPRIGPGAARGIDFNFNGWGGKQQHGADRQVAARVCTAAGVERVTTDLVLEGGALEVDGAGTAIITESCVLNDNRNPGWTRADVEGELAHLLGVRRVIWLPGISGRDITDGHTDFYARFARPGVVVAARDDDPDSFDHDVTRRHLEILRTATDADGRRLQVHELVAPDAPREEFLTDDFAAGYVNFFVCNGGVIAPEFGDRRADAAARDTLERLFPDRRVIQVGIDGIAAGGGGIHCATQQQPAASG